MYGEVSKFRNDLGVGVIRADDGQKYRFCISDVRNPARRLIGQEVDFEISDAHRPRAIILMAGSPWAVFV